MNNHFNFGYPGYRKYTKKFEKEDNHTLIVFRFDAGTTIQITCHSNPESYDAFITDRTGNYLYTPSFISDQRNLSYEEMKVLLRSVLLFDENLLEEEAIKQAGGMEQYHRQCSNREFKACCTSHQELLAWGSLLNREETNTRREEAEIFMSSWDNVVRLMEDDD